MKATITVITMKTCSKCPYVKKKARELVEADGGYYYEELDAFDDEEGAKLVKQLGIKTVPTIVYDGRVVIGTTVGELEAWLKARS